MNSSSPTATTPNTPAERPGVRIAVVGAHLEGQPLNHQLRDRNARFIERTTTAPIYRFYALETTPPKPGLVRVPATDPDAAAIEVEIWQLGLAEFGSFVAEVPAPLAIGQVRLLGGTSVSGFVCEPLALDGAVEITQFGGWRAYLARDSTP